MKGRDRESPRDAQTAAAAERLACWIADSHGAQDWEVKIEECSEPVAAALGVPFEAFQALVKKHVESRRSTGANITLQTERKNS